MTNNKQPTAMKLYTEEQVKKMLDLARFTYNSEDKILLSQIPIKLPSDEEIGKEASVRHYGTNFKHVFASGAEWMRDKIQGGNK
jgi:hypothetical protein